MGRLNKAFNTDSESDVKIRQLIVEKIDNQKNEEKKVMSQLSKVYKTKKKDIIKKALLAELGNDEKVMINQVQMRKKLKISLPTWLKYIAELREEGLVFERAQRGTFLSLAGKDGVNNK